MLEGEEGAKAASERHGFAAESFAEGENCGVF